MGYGVDGRHQVIRFDRELYVEQCTAAQTRASKPYLGANFKSVLTDCERYGVDHRNPVNHTSLMTAASIGNLKLVQVLLDAGADPAVVDNYGRTAWHLTILRSFSDEHYAAEIFPELHEMLVPPGISVQVDDRLVKIDNHTGEFLLFSIFSLGIEMLRKSNEPGLTAIRIEEALGRLPVAVVPPYRKKCSYISSLLSKNEYESGQPYNRKLFRRMRHGHYILNPLAQVKRGEEWHTVPDLLNLKLHERIVPSNAAWIIGLLQGMKGPPRASAAPMKVAAGGAVSQPVAGPRKSTRAQGKSPTQEALPLFPNLEADPAHADESANGFDKTPASTPVAETAERAGGKGA